MSLREVVTGSRHPAAEGLKLRWFKPGFPVQTALPISFQAPSLFILSRNMNYMAPLVLILVPAAAAQSRPLFPRRHASGETDSKQGAETAGGSLSPVLGAQERLHECMSHG